MNHLQTELQQKTAALIKKLYALTPAVFLNANIAIAIAAMASERVIDKMFRKYGISHKRFLLLHTLMLNGGTMTMPELTHKMHISRQAVALTVRFFESKGFIETSDTKDDRRIKKVSLTDKGLDFIEKVSMSENRMHIHNILMKVVNEREAKLLTDIMDALSERISETAHK